MFEKLRRAKSFIHRSKREEERPKNEDLDLSEASHLRRNVVINTETLQHQNNLKKNKENVSDQQKTTLTRQVSKSNEHLQDEVVEQLRRMNFGDSYSRKQAQKWQENGVAPSAFDRRQHPAFISERNFRRRSFGAEERARSAQKSGKNEKHVVHRNSGDVLNIFDRTNPAYRSKSKLGVNKSVRNSQESNKNDNNVDLRISGNIPSNFDRNNPAYRSENMYGVGKGRKASQENNRSNDAIHQRLMEEIQSNYNRKHAAYRSEGGFEVEIRAKHTQVTDRNDNNVSRKAVEDISNDFEQNNPVCWSEMSIQLLRQKCSEQNDNSTARIFSSDDDFLLNRKSIDLSYNFDRRSPAYVSDRARKVKPDVLEKSGLKNLFRKVKKHASKDSDTSSFSSGSASASASSSASTSIERNHPAYSSESGSSSQNTERSVTSNGEQSRKRNYNLTKSNSARTAQSYSSARTLSEENRKKVSDRLKKERDRSGVR